MIIHRRCHYCLLTRPSHNPVQGVLTRTHVKWFHCMKVWQQVAGASGQTADRLQVAWLHYQQAQWQDVLAMVQGIQPASAAQRRQLASLRAAAQQALGMDQ